jgi:hypothetical protein
VALTQNRLSRKNCYGYHSAHRIAFYTARQSRCKKANATSDDADGHNQNYNNQNMNKQHSNEWLQTHVSFGGAGGIRTPDLLSAIQARSQLRHSPKRNADKL